jgi:hypothetical protein
MSHITRIKTKIIDRDFLLQSLLDLGYAYEEGDLELVGFGGKKANVSIKVNLRMSQDIGFMKVGDSYELIADWSGVRHLKKKDFTRQLFQRYAYIAARTKLEAQGFTLVTEEIEQKGQIRLVLRRMV